MPKEITHIHLAERIRDQVNPIFGDVLRREERAFNVGSIAPDLFYYDLPFPLLEERSRERWGEIIHGRDGEDTMAHVVLLIDGARELRMKPSHSRAEALFAFVSGYLTHVAVDTVFHPYIYSITGNYYAPDEHERRRVESRHRLFETCLDQHILKTRGETLHRFGLGHRIALPSSQKEFLLTAFADSLREAHRPREDRHHVRRVTHRAWGRATNLISLFQNTLVVRTLIRFNRLFSGRFGGIAHLGYGPHRAMDSLDFAHPWEAPHPVTGKMLSGDLNQMMVEACRRGTSYLNAAGAFYLNEMESKELRSLLRPLSLNNGLERVPTNRMQYFRVHPALSADTDQR